MQSSNSILANQETIPVSLKPQYDFIVCGSGPTGSVIASRLSENPDVSVLLVEAGGSEALPEIEEAVQWTLNLSSPRVWSYESKPMRYVNNRSIGVAMGKILGGSSSINAGAWARGHREDWDSYANESGDPGWGYAAVLDIYRRVENWRGVSDPARRGTSGPVCIQQAAEPNDFLNALLESSESMGVPTFAMQNGEMMEHPQGATIAEVLTEQGKRRSLFRAYVYPALGRPNLTVLTEAFVERLVLDGNRVAGIELAYDGKNRRISAGLEVVLSTGALHTPKILMQSGIGDEQQLHAFDIPVIQHLPGVGNNLQEHPAVICNFEYHQPLPIIGSGYDFTAYWASNSQLSAPDILTCMVGFPVFGPGSKTYGQRFEHGRAVFAGLAQPKSRGRVLLSGKKPSDPIVVDTDFLSHPDDMAVLRTAFQLAQESHMSSPMRRFIKRPFGPLNSKGDALDEFIRDGVETYWHYSGTAKMGRDSMAVVDSNLRVYGISNLRVADASILPHVPRSNPQASCVVIGERGAELLKATHNY